ncbi:MAG: primosomal protein N' [Nitrospiria bacterium]
MPLQFLECVLPETDGRFHYHLPPERLNQKMMPGARILVPFGRGRRVAYFIREIARPDVSLTKPVIACLDEDSLFHPKLFKLLCWISEYYQTPLGGVLKTALPKGIHAVPRRRFSLVDREKARQWQGRSASGKAVINLLLEKGPCRESEIRKNLGRGLGRVFPNLKKQGLLREQWELGLPPIRPKILKNAVLKWDMVEAKEAVASFQKAAPRQAEVLGRLIASGGRLATAGFDTALRPALKRLVEKGAIALEKESVLRRPDRGEAFPKKGDISLNTEQARAVREIGKAVVEKCFSPFLLHGITGSGKTEVYLNAVEIVLKQGRGAILLLPEIGLTTHISARFQERFEEKVALLHSGLSGGERFDEWRRIQAGEAEVVIGARSAIFAPLEDVGVIIIDEEHDSSYRQEEGSRYHGRDAALVRGRDEKSVVILGSATPSFESYFNSEIGKYRKLLLPDRIDTRSLPAVRLVNLKEKASWVRPFFTKALYDAIKTRLAKNEQSLLFVNRRGFSPFLLCQDCGFTPVCHRCTVSLTFHKRLNQLVCHYCGVQKNPPSFCSECHGAHLNALGIGTEQIEESVRYLFPSARVARLDRDTTQQKGAYAEILSTMAKGGIDILIGTQMIVKGHDFPKVTLVGVISADMSLHVPDFRASERTFQLLTQVAGRAGRGAHSGEVIVQTFRKEDPAIQSAVSQDYVRFYQESIASREAMRYPPFCRLALLLLRHKSEETAGNAAAVLGKTIEKAIRGSDIKMLGPAPAPLLRLREEYRYQILLKGEDQRKIAPVLKTVSQAWRRGIGKGVRLDIEIDPQQFV